MGTSCVLSLPRPFWALTLTRKRHRMAEIKSALYPPCLDAFMIGLFGDWLIGKEIYRPRSEIFPAFRLQVRNSISINLKSFSDVRHEVNIVVGYLLRKSEIVCLLQQLGTKQYRSLLNQ